MSETIDPNAFRDFERSAHDRLADSYHAFFSSVTAHAAQPLLAAAKVGANPKCSMSPADQAWLPCTLRAWGPTSPASTSHRACWNSPAD